MSYPRLLVVIGFLVLLVHGTATGQKPQRRTTVAKGDIGKGNAAAADGARIQRVKPTEATEPSTTTLEREPTTANPQLLRGELFDAVTELAKSYHRQIATLNQLLPHLPEEQRKIAEAAIKSARDSRRSLGKRYGRESRSMSRQGPILSTARNQPAVQFPGADAQVPTATPRISTGLNPYRPLSQPPSTASPSRLQQLPLIPAPSSEYPPAIIDSYPIPPR